MLRSFEEVEKNVLRSRSLLGSIRYEPFFYIYIYILYKERNYGFEISFASIS